MESRVSFMATAEPSRRLRHTRPRPCRDGGSEPRLARIAAMIADPARSRMLAYLLDGHLASAGELAAAAAIAPATASGHFGKLLAEGLLVCEPRGRHRYFRLADGEVARALEALALLAERATHERAWADPAMVRLRYARRCYGHLAGRLGVALFEGLVRSELLVPAESGGLELHRRGEQWLRSIGFDPAALRHAGRFAYPCLDWSERRDHLAGRLGAGLLEHFLARGWLAQEGSGPPRGGTARAGALPSHRCLALTAVGRGELLPRIRNL